MTRWVRAGELAGLPSGGSRSVSVEGRDVALFNVDGRVYATSNVCPHRGAPLSDGRLHDGVITCPWHGWQFDVMTGQLLMNPRECLTTYPVEVRGKDLYVGVDSPHAPKEEKP